MNSAESCFNGKDELDSLIAEYVGRLQRGEPVEPEDVLIAHPEHGVDILAALRSWADLEAEANSPLSSRRFGDYRLSGEIGRGGMGVVYDAWQDSLDRRVALKVLPPGLAVDTRASTRFLREAQIAAKLAHPNVVAVYGAGVEDQTPLLRHGVRRRGRRLRRCWGG